MAKRITRTTASKESGGVIQVVIPKLFVWQNEVRKRNERFLVVACARQIGKTRLGSILSIEAAAKGGRVWWVAPNFSLTEAGYEYMVEICDAIPGIKHTKDTRVLTFPGGGYVQVRSADDPSKIRSKALDLVVMDEAAYMSVDAWDSIRPALSTTQGRAIFLSSPRGKNYFWDLYLRGQDQEHYPDWWSISYSQYASPLISREEIEEARRTLSERTFRREIMGEFVDAGGEVFINVRNVAILQPAVERIASHQYVAGVDWGSKQDFTVIAVMDATTYQQVEIVRIGGADFQSQYNAVMDMYERWKPYVIMAENNNIGQVHIQELQRRELPVASFNTNWITKRDLIESWAKAIELEEVQLLRHPLLIQEHESYESTVTPSGVTQYYAPRGRHDDIVIASALAWKAVTGEQVKPVTSLKVRSYSGLYSSREPRTSDKRKRRDYDKLWRG